MEIDEQKEQRFFKLFGSARWELQDLVKKIVTSENYQEEFENQLNYYDNEWLIMSHYQLPKGANLEEAYIAFLEEVEFVVNGGCL